ncbi:MAG: sigma-70 family RNA polymerase sigma factor [Chitinophagales bacterium]
MQNRQQFTQEQILKLLRQKDKRAVSVLYQQYAKTLYGVIFKILDHKELANDVLQETFCKIWQRFSQYDDSKGRLFTWMLNIARNSAIDKTRSKEYKKLTQYQDQQLTIENNFLGLKYSNNTDLIGIKDLINNLEPKYKNLIDLIYFQGYTQQEAAQELSLPMGTVKTRLRTAILLLRKIVVI